MKSSNTNNGPLVQVVGPTDNWILERLARRLAAKLPYAEFVPWKPRPDETAKIAYYINYALYPGPSGLIDVGFFTHYDETQQFLERAWRLDFCVSMSKKYADWLFAQGVRRVTHIPMGFDYYRFRPCLVLGVISKLDHPRKGRHLVDRLQELPFVQIVKTEGETPEGCLRDLYQRIDYVLIPATVEGGPMSLLEGLAMGKPIIAPDSIGLVPEFRETEHIRRYHVGDGDALEKLILTCYQEKLERTRLVEDRTWDRWAKEHHSLFIRLLEARRIPVPQPAEGFRFGMIGELEIPPGIDVEPLETAVDKASSHLYYGQFDLARSVLEGILPHYPFARKLVDTIPKTGCS